MIGSLLLPPRCLACGVVSDGALCPHCMTGLRPPAPRDACVPLQPGVVAVAVYRYAVPLSTAIKAVKSGGLRQGAGALAALLAPSLPAGVTTTWVPATRRRRRARGLDLAETLAGPEAVRLLERVADRPDQPELTAAQPRHSPVGSFRATRRAPRDVVLVDDVRATAGTLTAAALALRAAGAQRVLAVTLSCAARPRASW